MKSTKELEEIVAKLVSLGFPTSEKQVEELYEIIGDLTGEEISRLKVIHERYLKSSSN
jgi:hypothetical protein